MEESELRREKLKAMRMEAAEGAETHNATASYSLGNPLVEAALPEPSIAPRFDFYTDPMSAFSGRTKVSHQTPQPPRPMNPPIIPGGSFGRPMVPPSRPQQAYMNGAPGTYPPGSYQTPGVPGTYILPGSYQTPGPFERPMGPPSRPQLGKMNNAPGAYIPTGPYQNPGPFGRPMGPPSTPQLGYMNDAPGAYGFPSNSQRGTGFVQRGSPRPSYGPRGGLPYHDSGRGRSEWHGGNSSQNGPGYHQAGRGRGHWRGNNNPGQRQGGRGHCDSVSDEFKAHLYYNKSMLEDPWKDLQPTLWKGPSGTLSTPSHPKLSSKKARVSEEPVKYATGKSLAEDLAESFHAATSCEARDNSTEDNS